MTSDINLMIKKFNNFYVDYNDSKENERYLICFKVSNDELKFNVTNGENQWFLNINDKLSSTLQQNTQLKHQLPSQSHNYSEFLECLFNVLSKRQFHLQKVYNTETSSDMLKLETQNLTKKQISFFLKSNENYKPIEYLKDICFNLFDKNIHLESELKKLNAQESFTKITNSDKASNLDSGKKNLMTPSIQMNQRKTGMSILNPQSRKRKVQKGVQFGNENDDSESESD